MDTNDLQKLAEVMASGKPSEEVEQENTTGNEGVQQEPNEDNSNQEEEVRSEVQSKQGDEVPNVSQGVQDGSDDSQQRGSDQDEKESVDSKEEEAEPQEEKTQEEIFAELQEQYKEEPQQSEEGEEGEGENSSLNNQDQVDINAFVSEKTGGKFKGLDELLEYAKQEPTVTSNFASDRIEKLNDIEKNGGDIMQVLKFESLKLEELDVENTSDAITLIKEKLKMEDPDATEQDLHYLISKDYAVDEDMDDDERNYQISKMKRTARQAKRELLDKKKQLELPKGGTSKNVEAQQKQIEEMQKQWTDTVSKATSNYNEETFTLGESKEFKYVVNDEMRKTIADNIVNPQNYWKRYTNQDGSTNLDLLMSDQILSLNKETILKSAYNQGIAEGARDVLNKLTNAKPKGQSKPNKRSKKSLSVEQQIAANLLGDS